MTPKAVDRTRILTRSEVAAVLADLNRKARRSLNTRQNLVLFRLATCCGLRVSECVGLTLANVHLASGRPYIHVPASIAKRGRARKVPLWWDAATLADLSAWKAAREQDGASGVSPFLCCLNAGKRGKALSVRNAEARFKASIKPLGTECVRDLSIHSGRHSFCSHALAGGRSLAEVRDAAGHANIATTSIYLHSAAADDDTVGNLFDFGG